MTIESPRIPIIDPTDTSLWSSVREFFDGYFYYGDLRYRIIPSKDTEITRLGRETGDHLFSTILKIVLYVTVVAPLVGVGFYLYNVYHQAQHKYQIFDEKKFCETKPPLPKQDPSLTSSLLPQPPPEPVSSPIPKPPAVSNDTPEKPEIKPPANTTKPILIFSEEGASLKECIPSNTLFGDYTYEKWVQMLREYREKNQDLEDFLFQMLVLKRDLLTWKRGRAEEHLDNRINRLTFVEKHVPEFNTTPLRQIFNRKNVVKLSKLRDADDVIVPFILSRFQNAINPDDLTFGLRLVRTFKCFPVFLEALMKDLNATQLGAIAQHLMANPKDLKTQILFYTEFVNFKAASREDKVKAVFQHFWPIWEVQVDFVIGKIDFFRFLLNSLRDSELVPVLSTVPTDFNEEQLKTVADRSVNMNRKEGGFNISKYTTIVKTIPRLAPHVKDYKPLW